MLNIYTFLGFFIIGCFIILFVMFIFVIFLFNKPTDNELLKESLINMNISHRLSKINGCKRSKIN